MYTDNPTSIRAVVYLVNIIVQECHSWLGQQIWQFHTRVQEGLFSRKAPVTAPSSWALMRSKGNMDVMFLFLHDLQDGHDFKNAEFLVICYVHIIE